MRYSQRGGSHFAKAGAVTPNMLIELLENMGYTVLKKPAICSTPIGNLFKDEKNNERGLRELISFDSGKTPLVEWDTTPRLMILLVDDDDRGLQNDLSKLPPEYSSWLIAVRPSFGKGSLYELQSNIYSYLLSIDDLLTRFEHALTAEEDGFQQLVDVAGDYFGKFINITDANNALLAYTKNIEPCDEVNQSLIKLGYHSESYLKLERSAGYISEKIERQKGVVCYPSTSLMPCALITSVMRVEGQYVGHIVLSCDDDEVTPGTMDTFALFAMYCNRYAQSHTEGPLHGDSYLRAFITKLTEERNVDSVFVDEQAGKFKLKIDSDYILITIGCKEEFGDQLEFLASDVDRKIPYPSVTFLHNGVLYCLVSGEGSKSLAGDVVAILREGIGKVSYIAFVSDVFYRLTDIYFANRQIHAILKYESRIQKILSMDNTRDHDNVMQFRDAFCFYWGDTFADQTIRVFSISHLLVNLIAKEDEVRGTDDLNLLATFLINERRATQAGKQMHMHRNGVLYRIGKIERTYGIDLSDFLTRQYLLMSLSIKLVISDDFLSRPLPSHS